jgi:hypothetical protein
MQTKQTAGIQTAVILTRQIVFKKGAAETIHGQNRQCTHKRDRQYISLHDIAYAHACVHYACLRAVVTGKYKAHITS